MTKQPSSMPDAMEISTTEVSGISATTAAPLCSTAPSPLPSLPTSRDQHLDVNLNRQALDPILRTPSKGSRSSIRKSRETTPSSSTACSPSAPPSKVPRLLLPSPSPGKRWLQAQADGEGGSPGKTLDNQIQELREVIQHGPAEVSYKKCLKFRTEC